MSSRLHLPNTIDIDGIAKNSAQAVRRSDIRNLSLRQNKISNLGTVSVALIIRDWVDTGSTGNNPFNNDRHVLFDMETSRAEGENGIEAQHEDVGGSIPHAIPLQDEHLGRLVTLDLKGNDIRVSRPFLSCSAISSDTCVASRVESTILLKS